MTRRIELTDYERDALLDLAEMQGHQLLDADGRREATDALLVAERLDLNETGRQVAALRRAIGKGRKAEKAGQEDV